MVFKARKTRQKKEQEPLVKGGAMRPSAAIKDWYEGQLRGLIVAMIADYRETIDKVMQLNVVKEFYAQDAATPTDAFTKAFENLHGKWKSVFMYIGRKIAKEFTEKIDEHNKSTVHKALSTMGVEQPRLTYTENVNHTLEATQEFNHTLITGLQQEAHERIFNVVMLSLTSPNPEEQGQPYIISHLRNVEGMTKKRAKLIARDQTSKAYSALNIERAKEAGVTKFIWRHSSAGKVPRYTHVQKDGQVFELNDPKLWEGPKADQGPPGHAINCLPGDARLNFVDGCEKLFSRLYNGKLTRFVTESGRVFTATPNHPVFTQRGWVAVDSLNLTDYVLEISQENMASDKLNNDQTAPTFAEFFSFLSGRTQHSTRARGTLDDFHGDGVPDSDVNIVDVTGQLLMDFVRQFSQFGCKHIFAEANDSTLSGGFFNFGFNGVFASTYSILRRFSQSLTFRVVSLGHSSVHSFRPVSWRNTVFNKNFIDDLSRTIKKIGDIFNAIPGIIRIKNLFASFSHFGKNHMFGEFESVPGIKKFSRVTNISSYNWSGHVYNLQSKKGWYVADGIVTHNCRCYMEYVLTLD